MKTLLEPIFTNQKSFYGKAIVIHDYSNNTISLVSYETEVAKIDLATNQLTVYGTYSQTTLKHIKEFIQQNGFECGTKKFIEEKYMSLVR